MSFRRGTAPAPAGDVSVVIEGLQTNRAQVPPAGDAPNHYRSPVPGSLGVGWMSVVGPVGQQQSADRGPERDRWTVLGCRDGSWRGLFSALNNLTFQGVQWKVSKADADLDDVSRYR